MNKLALKAQKRVITGRKVKRLRKEGLLPANIYGKKNKSQAVQVDVGEFLKVFSQAGETGLLELQVNGERKPVLIHNVQTDPVSDVPLHADFLQVDLKEKVVAQVPVELSGEAPAEKQGLGTVVQYIDEIEVEALPADLPEKFELDTSQLTEVDQAIFVKDIKVDPKKIEIKQDPDQILVKVEPPRKPEEEVAPPVEVEAEVTPEAQGAPEGVSEKPQEKEQEEEPKEAPK